MLPAGGRDVEEQSEPKAPRKAGDGFHVLELSAVRGGETRTVRTAAHTDAEDDDFNRVWRRLSAEGWTLTVARWIA